MTDHKATDEPEESAGIIHTELNATPISLGDRAVLNARVQHAFEQIAGDETLTGALTDDAAEVLLNWALGETRRLVTTTQEMDDHAAQALLAPKIHQLRRYLRKIAGISAAQDSPTDTLHDLLASPTYSKP